MKILVVGRTLPQKDTGMMGIFEFEQAKALSEQIDCGYLYCDNRSVKKLRKIRTVNGIIEGVPTIGINLPIGGLYRKAFENVKAYLFIRQYKLFKKKYWKPDIVHIHFPLISSNIEIIKFLKNENIKIVITEHWSKVQSKTIEQWRKKQLDYTFNQTDAFITVSEKLKQSVYELINVDKGISVIPNMVSEKFIDSQQSKNNDNKFSLISIGRLVEGKRFDVLIKAFIRANTDANMELIIIGDGPERKQLEKLANGKKEIQFKGFLNRTDTASLLKSADVFVSASILETFGVPFIEAICSGKPIIGASNLPIIEHFKPYIGEIFEADNINDLSEKIVTVMNNNNFYDEQEIRKYGVEHFSPKSVCKKLTNIYKEITK